MSGPINNLEDLKAQAAVLEALSTYIAVSQTEVQEIKDAATSLADNLAKFVVMIDQSKAHNG
jgi:hypothetical protein